MAGDGWPASPNRRSLRLSDYPPIRPLLADLPKVDKPYAEHAGEFEAPPIAAAG